MSTQDFDVIILGAGTAGLNAFSQVRRQTEKVLLLEGGSYGTTCAKVGCMPSKVLIETAKLFYGTKHFEERGIKCSSFDIDTVQVMNHMRTLRDKFVSGVMGYVKHIGSHTQKGYGKIISFHEIQVGEKIFKTKKIIIATGSSPIIPDDWKKFGKKVITSDEFFELPYLPKRIAVIGLGVIGAELGQALSLLGIDVVGVGRSHHLAGITDPVILEKMKSYMQETMTLWLGSEATLKESENGILVSTSHGEKEVDLVLASLGRKENLSQLGLENIGLSPQDALSLRNENTMQIGNLPLYIAGDASSYKSIFHEVGDDGFIAGKNAVSPKNIPYERRTPLKITYTNPPFVSIGEDFNSLSLENIIIGERSFETQTRAITMAQNKGLLRIYADKASHQILGAQMNIPQGDTLAPFLTLAISQKLTVEELLYEPYYHPTLLEGVQDALQNILKQSGTLKSFFSLPVQK